MIDDLAWLTAKEKFPVGLSVQATVDVVRPFGFFVTIPGCPATAVVDAIAYKPHGIPVNPTQWPAIGITFEATIADHVEHNRQIKLRVDASN
ncbi:RNA-binding protein [Streptomyces roseifaciens]|uniref:RNA-binding protein n=1 Tax=Streptomyces roseifaciens TaxID=1488406 RepID=UPI000A9EEB1E|nr:RNA-binding protein [Streptomyces roseifaciens]